MSYNYTDCLEIVAMDRFKCGLDDLKVLEFIYSDLAEQSEVDFKMLGCMNDLHVMVDYAYTTMRDYIVRSLRCEAHSSYIELIPDDVDNYIKYVVDTRVKLDINNLADKIETVRPLTEDLTNVKFNSIIDEALELTTEGYEDYPEHVAEVILQVAYDKGLIGVSKEFRD